MPFRSLSVRPLDSPDGTLCVHSVRYSEVTSQNQNDDHKMEERTAAANVLITILVFLSTAARTLSLQLEYQANETFHGKNDKPQT